MIRPCAPFITKLRFISDIYKISNVLKLGFVKIKKNCGAENGGELL